MCIVAVHMCIVAVHMCGPHAWRGHYAHQAKVWVEPIVFTLGPLWHAACILVMQDTHHVKVPRGANMTKTILTTIALSTTIAACSGGPDDKGHKKAEINAVFSKATDEDLSTTFLVASGTDLSIAYFSVMTLDMDASSCVGVSDVDDGLRYTGLGGKGCENSMQGEVTVLGIDGPGWAWGKQPEEVAITFQDAVIPVDMGDGPSSHRLDGMLINRVENKLPVLFESNLRHSVDGWFDVKSRMIWEADATDPLYGIVLTGSQATVAGVGTFEVSGTTQLIKKGRSNYALDHRFVLRGAETMSFELNTEDSKNDCVPFEIDGEADEYCGI